MTAEPAPAPAGSARRHTGDYVRTLSVHGISVRVSTRAGRGAYVAEPPLLLCNGIGVSLEVLQPLVDHLHPDRGLVRFDVPGVGGSPLPPTPYTVAGLASWVAEMMSQLGHRRFDVFGLSWGGGLAQQLAVQSRRRVRRIVLAATGTGWMMVPASPRVLKIMSTPRRHRDATYALEVAPTIYGGSMRHDPLRAARLLHHTTRSGPKRGYYYQLAAMAGWTSLPFLKLIRQPVLVLGGEDDPIIPTANPRMHARLLPRGRLHLYPGGHLGVVTEADELAPVIEQFLNEGAQT